MCFFVFFVFFFKQKTAYEMRISDWSSDVCSSDLVDDERRLPQVGQAIDQVDSRDRGAAGCVAFGRDRQEGGADRLQAGRAVSYEAVGEEAGHNGGDDGAHAVPADDGRPVEPWLRRHLRGGVADRKSTRLNSSH